MGKVQALNVAQATAESWDYDLGAMDGATPVTPGNLIIIGFSAQVPMANVVDPTGGAGSAWSSFLDERSPTNSVAFFWRVIEEGDVGEVLTVAQDTGSAATGTGYAWEAAQSLDPAPLQTPGFDHGAPGGMSPYSVSLGNLEIPGAGWFVVANHRTTGTDGGNETWAAMSVATGHSQGSFAELLTVDDTDINPTPSWPTSRAGVGIAMAFAPVAAAESDYVGAGIQF